MANSPIYYGYRITEEGFYNLHAVLQDGSENTVQESFNLAFIESECERLNRIVDKNNREAGKYTFEH